MVGVILAAEPENAGLAVVTANVTLDPLEACPLNTGLAVVTLIVASAGVPSTEADPLNTGLAVAAETVATGEPTVSVVVPVPASTPSTYRR